MSALQDEVRAAIAADLDAIREELRAIKVSLAADDLKPLHKILSCSSRRRA